ncbi:MAG: MarR family transcriptional regulator [Cellulosilyticum sp.]|nr:MarR family transcriptional regulator [Cellulosilyticum sp.]
MNRRIGKLVSILHRKSQIYLDKRLNPFDITAAEVPVLLPLYHHDGTTQEELVVHTGLDKSAVTRTLQGLITKGYVTKEKDEKDLRCNRIYLTPSAFTIQKKIYEVLDDLNHIIMHNFDDEERTETYDLLERMVENIQGEK